MTEAVSSSAARFERVLAYRVHVVCKYCRSSNVRKFGRYKDTQYHYCNDCRRKFKADGALFHMKYTAEQVSSALDLHRRGLSINGIRERFRQEYGGTPSSSTVFKWIHKLAGSHKAPLEVDFKVGENWGELKKYEPVGVQGE